MPKQGHQGLTSAKVITFSEMANQFKTIIWRTTQKDENTTQRIKKSSSPQLTEHLAAQWLSPEELHSVPWLPADVAVTRALLQAIGC